MSEAPAPATPPSSGRSCRRGCLFLLVTTALVSVAVVLGAWLAWVNFARPWLEQRRARLVHDYPLVGTAWNYLAGGEIKVTAKGISIREEAGGHRGRSAFPGDVYVPEGAERSAFRSEGRSGLAVLTYARKEPAPLLSECRTEMRRRGWKDMEAADPPGGKRLFFTRSNRTAEFLALPARGGMRLWIQVSRKIEAGKPAASPTSPSGGSPSLPRAPRR